MFPAIEVIDFIALDQGFPFIFQEKDEILNKQVPN